VKKNFAGKEEEKYEIQRLAMALVAVCTVLFLASVAMGPMLFTPRSRASPRDDADQASPVLAAIELNRISAKRLR